MLVFFEKRKDDLTTDANLLRKNIMHWKLMQGSEQCDQKKIANFYKSCPKMISLEK